MQDSRRALNARTPQREHPCQHSPLNQPADQQPSNQKIAPLSNEGGLFSRAERTPGEVAVSGSAMGGAAALSSALPWTNSVPSLVRQGITQHFHDFVPICQALPGLVAGQYTFNGECVFPAPSKPPSQIAVSTPTPTTQMPLPWNGHQLPFCPDAGWLEGTCEHGTIRWLHLNCKQRDCPVCGKQRRLRIAWRISHGIEVTADHQGAAWFVGTFHKDLSKKDAVKVQNKFVRWLRKNVDISLQYAATWENTRNGRLHLNLILAPWKYIPQHVLSEKWHRFGGGHVVWIKRADPAIGSEAAKTNSLIGSYVSKWEQMVMTGRGVNYSKGWPKLPCSDLIPRQGAVEWRYFSEASVEARIHWYERELGYWYLVSPSEYASALGEPCSCFSRSELSPTTTKKAMEDP